MAWTIDRTDRLIEGNLNRTYATPPQGHMPLDLSRLLDRLRAKLAGAEESAPQVRRGHGP